MHRARVQHKVARWLCGWCDVYMLRPKEQPKVSVAFDLDEEGAVDVSLSLSEPELPAQAWYADDSQAVGRLKAIREWWDILRGPVRLFP